MTNTETRRPFAPLGDALRDVRAAGQRLRAAQQEAWERYLQEVDEALASDLAPEGTTAEGDDPVHDLVAAVHGRLDDLRLQARLGMMEGGDLLAQLRAALDDIAARMRTPLR